MPAGARADYEALRRGVLDGGAGDRERGLALLMRRGLAAWIRAWSACTVPAGTADGARHEPAIAVLPSVRGEVTRLLVTMALSAHHKEARP
jgi:hypothetical protein